MQTEDFKTPQELYDNISRGGEIEFSYCGKNYSITHGGKEIYVMEAYNDASMVTYKEPKDVGLYSIDGRKIKDILGEIVVTFRCF